MFSLKIISPKEVIFEGDADFVVLPASEGQLGILSGHAPLLSTLKKGRVRIRQHSSTKTLDILGGFLEVLNNRVTVLTK